MTFPLRISFCVMLVFVASVANEAVAGGEQQCNRACLRDVLDRYLNAIIQHDPQLAPLAASARATENAAPLLNGSGIWRTATGLGTVQRRYFDAVEGQAAYFGIIDEGQDPAITSLRLKVRNARIVEAEWTVARRRAGGMFSVEGLIAQPPPVELPLPRAERTSRAILIATANRYFDGIEHHDGSQVPHVVGCDRIENGLKVTNREFSHPPGMLAQSAPTSNAPEPPSATAVDPAKLGAAPGMAQEGRAGDCTSGFDMFSHTIVDASHRRYSLVDEQAGVVWSATLFHRPAGSTLKRNLLTEYFYEKSGKISALYAAMYYLDADAADSPGW